MQTTRERLTDAVVDLVVDRGLDAVSVREVAAAAGVTGGTVQHHFPTKQAMLIAALDQVTDSFQARCESALTGLEPASALRRLAEELLPLDEPRLREGKVWLAFVARASVDEQLAAIHRQSWQQLEDVLAALISAARGDATGAGQRAGLLLAAVDGLATAGLVEPERVSTARMSALLTQALAGALD